MKLVRSTSQDDEPGWDDFSTSATDFRPQWDGDLVNVFTTIRPKPTADETERFAILCARDLATWILKKRRRFKKGDRFQIIVGWPKDVRPTGRQIIKTGGNFNELEGIASAATEIQMHGNWTATVFETTNSEQGAGRQDLTRRDSKP